MRIMNVALAGVALASLLAFGTPAAAKRHTNAATANANKSTARVKKTSVSSNASVNSNATVNPSANANNGSTVAIVPGACDSLTDGDNLGCMFSGNINTSTSGNSSYLLAQDAYNAAFAPDITLTPLAELDGNGSANGISLTLNAALNGGTFMLAPGVDLLYYAVKAGNDFVLYQYNGINTFSTADLTVGNGQTPALSHIVFFGNIAGGVPEPATWAMLLVGMAMVGGGVRRRQRNRTASRQFA